MVPGCSLPHLQGPSTCPYPEPDQSNPCPTPSHLLTVNFNIILPSTAWSSKSSLSLSFSRQNPVYSSPLHHTCYMLRLSHSSRFVHPNSIGWTVQIINLLKLYKHRLNIQAIRKDYCVPPYSRVQNCIIEAVCCPSWYKQGCCWSFIFANCCYVDGLSVCLSVCPVGACSWEHSCSVFRTQFDILKTNCLQTAQLTNSNSFWRSFFLSMIDGDRSMTEVLCVNKCEALNTVHACVQLVVFVSIAVLLWGF